VVGSEEVCVVFESSVSPQVVLARYVDLRGCATFQSGGGPCGMIVLVSPQTRYSHTSLTTGDVSGPRSNLEYS
jgi:hypothetical protein